MTEPQKTRVLVTGATGFLGGNILKTIWRNPRIECIAACRKPAKLSPQFGGETRVGDLLGMLPAIVPRLKTFLVPWLGGGKKHLPLVADSDLGSAFELAVLANSLDDYESFNICGAHFPTLREVVSYVAQRASVPRPFYSVPYPAGYLFGWLMETLEPVLPGSSPFLTRSIVHLCEDWICPNNYAHKKLGYVPRKDWRAAVDEHLADLKNEGFPWPVLCQP